MKIAMTHVDLPNESKGGVAAQVHHLANAMVKRGHEVTMFTFSPAYAESLYRVHQYPLEKRIRPFGSFALAWSMSKTDFSEFDLLHTHGDNYLVRQKSVPHVRTFYGSARDEAATARSLKRRLYQRLMVHLESAGAKVADVNAGISQSTQERIPAVTHIVPCGVDVSRFQPGEKSATPSVLFVGTVGGRKRGTLLADAFTRVIRPQIPNVELWSVADAPMDGEGIINFGRVSYSELIRLFSQAWVFCLPSSYEGFGVPYIEAMASGTAVVATNNAGAIEVLADGKYGVIAQDDDLGPQIVKLLQDAELRSQYARIGLERVVHYDWPSVVQQYESLYELVKGTPAASRVVTAS